MSEFVRFVIYLISFFKKSETVKDNCKVLIECLDGVRLLRDEYEIMMRIIIFEAGHRGFSVREVLYQIINDEFLNPDIYSVTINADELLQLN